MIRYIFTINLINKKLSFDATDPLPPPIYFILWKYEVPDMLSNGFEVVVVDDDMGL